MTFISSFRATADDPDGTYAKNQLFAKASWERVASKIYFFNAFEPQMASTKTTFIPADRYPRILDLIELAAMQDDWCAILNADIWIAQNFPQVEARLRQRKALCASSWRYNFDPAIGPQSGVHNDNGLDFFAAVPSVWKKAYEMCDERLCVSSTFWDCWVMSLFGTYFQQGFFNITKHKVIFHPNHGGRVHGPRFVHDTVQIYGWPTMANTAHL